MAALLAGALRPVTAAPALWLYAAENLQVADRVAHLERLLERAHAAGYSRLLLSDSKFSRLGDVPEFYFANVARLVRAARSNVIEVVPAVFPVGYSNDLLWHDPDLAEGPPVKDARFVVTDGVARHAPEPVGLKGGDMSDLALWSWKDATVTGESGAAVMRDPRGGNARLVQSLRVVPWRQYLVTARVRTREFRGQPEIKVLAGEPARALNFDDLGVSPTQDWRVHHAVFNSLGFDQVTLYLGAWGADSGELGWDDVEVREIALVNLVRRDGAPFKVRTEAGRELTEGREFESVRDPRMGRVKWPGDYDVYHEPPDIRMRGEWPDGTVLRVSYQHVASIHAGQVMMDIAEPRAEALLQDQARRVHALFGAAGYMMSHDEIRVLGWSEAFRRTGLTPGELIARNARFCRGVLRDLAPGAAVHVWSDMFDPSHNAVEGPYYLVNGTLAGAWEGLDPGVVVVNWNHGRRDESLRFFAARGHRQVIAAYYDNPLRELDDWLESAKGVPDVVGWMYTTWRGDYSKLESFAGRVRAARP